MLLLTKENNTVLIKKSTIENAIHMRMTVMFSKITMAEYVNAFFNGHVIDSYVGAF